MDGIAPRAGPYARMYGYAVRPRGAVPASLLAATRRGDRGEKVSESIVESATRTRAGPALALPSGRMLRRTQSASVVAAAVAFAAVFAFGCAQQEDLPDCGPEPGCNIHSPDLDATLVGQIIGAAGGDLSAHACACKGWFFKCDGENPVSCTPDAPPHALCLGICVIDWLKISITVFVMVVVVYICAAVCEGCRKCWKEICRFWIAMLTLDPDDNAFCLMIAGPVFVFSYFFALGEGSAVLDGHDPDCDICCNQFVNGTSFHFTSYFGPVYFLSNGCFVGVWTWIIFPIVFVTCEITLLRAVYNLAFESQGYSNATGYYTAIGVGVSGLITLVSTSHLKFHHCYDRWIHRKHMSPPSFDCYLGCVLFWDSALALVVVLVKWVGPVVMEKVAGARRLGTKTAPTGLSVGLVEMESATQHEVPQADVCRCGEPWNHGDKFCSQCGATHDDDNV
eukprot:SAG31_NODE_944_length_10844_cov_11.214053_1_plen_451_part_00